MKSFPQNLILDTRHIAKHIPGTLPMRRLLEKEGSSHVFLDKATMLRVTETIIEQGQFTGTIRGHDRYGCYFSEPIGYRLNVEGNQIPLYYGEIKVTGDRYHVIPRTRPSQ